MNANQGVRHWGSYGIPTKLGGRMVRVSIMVNGRMFSEATRVFPGGMKNSGAVAEAIARVSARLDAALEKQFGPTWVKRK